jgi:hypothetical protein
LSRSVYVPVADFVDAVRNVLIVEETAAVVGSPPESGPA